MPELQQPDIVGNFLSSYGTAQAQQQAQKDRAFQQQRVMRQDERAEKQFDMEMDVGQLRLAAGRAEAFDNILRKVRPGDEASLNQAKSEFVNTFGGDPQAVAGVTMDRVMELRAESDLKLKELRARIAATDRSNRPVAGGPGGLRGAPGMPGGKAPPEWAAKDAMWVKRGTAANNQFTPELTQALTTSTKDWIARGIGDFNSGLGNVAQTKQSRQASQIAKNFVAVVLRKDTGAAVTPQEFEFYQDIFIPQYGDDEGTLQLKSTARNTFLQALGAGLSNYQALQSMNITPPEGLAPQDGEAGAGDQTAADGEVTWTFDAQGNLVQAK
jgi:hypothetical protein